MTKATLLICLALLPAPASALTLADLRTQARTLALDNGTRLRFSTSTIDTWLNEAQKIITLEIKPILKSTSFELASGTTYYSLPSDFLQISRVTLRHQEIGETTPEALAGKVGWNWFESKGLPSSYYINFSSRTKLAFYPWPNTTSSTGTVRYEYWAQSTDMSATTDQPWNSITELAPFHHALAYFAAARMAAIDGRPDLAVFYRTTFLEEVERMRREAKSRPSYRPSLQPGTPLNRTGP